MGIGLIYIYFQVPLMVLVFLPAIDGLKLQWREASESLGSSTWQYVVLGGPLLAPAFFGATLLLFANALSAFATIEASGNQIAYTVPQEISTSLSSEVGLANVNAADLLAFGMIVIVAVVMTCYALLQRRAGRWLRWGEQGKGPLATPAGRPRGMQRRRLRRLNAFRYVVFTLFGAFVVLPLLAMFRFSLEGSKLGAWSLAAWKDIVSSRAWSARWSSPWNWPSSPASSWCCCCCRR